MGDTTEIAWTNKTWNPWQGCHKVSAGCAECYMFRDKKRYGQDPSTVVRSAPATFRRPLSKSWAEPALVFTCSWSDFFIKEADPWREEAWDIIRRTPHLTYQILTKRPERIAACLPANWGDGWRNVWLGTTAENRRALNRLDLLRAVPAAVTFVSAEPLLGDLGRFDLYGIDWVIVGGESGPRARPCDVAWIRSIVQQTKAAGVPCFVKQLGARVDDRNDHVHHWPDRLIEEDRFADDDEDTGYQGAPVRVHTRDRSGADPSEWPEDLRVRQMPGEGR